MKLTINRVFTIVFFVFGIIDHIHGDHPSGTAYLAFSSALYAHVRLDNME